jgi:hypothetical protein
MSEHDVEVVRRSFDVWNAGEVGAIRRIYTEDAVIDGGSELGRTLDADDPVGHWSC